jgi:hypothetical protein
MVRNPANQNKIVWLKEDRVIEQTTKALRSFAMPEDLMANTYGGSSLVKIDPCLKTLSQCP